MPLLGIFAGADATYTNTTAVAGPRDTVDGSLITACAGMWNDSDQTPPVITDSLGNTWTTYTIFLGANVIMTFAYNDGGTRGAGHTVTATWGYRGNTSLTAQEWSGLDLSQGAIVNGQAAGEDDSPVGSINPATASLVVAMLCYDGAGGVTMTPISPAIQASEQDEGNVNQAQNVSYQDNIGGTVTFNWVLNASRPWAMAMVCFPMAVGLDKLSYSAPPKNW